MKNRGFEKISEKQRIKDFDNKIADNDILLPIRKTAKSAGYDFILPYDILFKSNQKIIIPTGIKAFMKEDEWLSIHIRSSLGFKHNFRLCNQTGVIDSDYYNNPDNEGHIFIAIQNEGDKDISLKKGEGFAQGIFMKFLKVDNDLSKNERTGGIGSTNRSDKNE